MTVVTRPPGSVAWDYLPCRRANRRHRGSDLSGADLLDRLNERLGSPTRVASASALAAVLVYLGALWNGFAYDDLFLILEDPGLRQFDGLWQRLLEPSWPTSVGAEIGAWRPVTTGTWALTYIASGGSPVAFHAVEIVLHAVVTFLATLLVCAIAPVAVAALTGMLFAVHPVHVEAVANVAGTAELTAATFAIAACLVHVRGGRSYGLGRVFAVCLLYFLALLSKEGAAVVPLLILLLDGARRDVRLPELPTYVKERFTLYALLTATLVLVLVLRLDVLGTAASASHPSGAEILRDAPRVWTVFSAWPHYLRLLLFPATLAADYAPGIIPVVFSWTPQAVSGLVLGIIVFGGSWLLWRRAGPLDVESDSGRLVALGVLWTAAGLLPVANVLYLAPVLVAERTLYLPSLGACLVIAWTVHFLARRRDARLALLGVLLILAGALRTATRVPAWADSFAIMEALIDDQPASGTAWLALGRTLAGEGRQAEALTAFGYAIQLLNSEYRPATEVGSHLTAMNRPASARFFLRRAWREHPEWYTAPGLLAAAELAAGNPTEAAAAARAATILEPTNASMHHLLAQAYANLERWPEAVSARRASLAHGFDDRARSWLLLALEEANRGDTVAGVAALDSAALRPMDDTETAALADLRARFGGGE